MAKNLFSITLVAAAEYLLEQPATSDEHSYLIPIILNLKVIKLTSSNRNFLELVSSALFFHGKLKSTYPLGVRYECDAS